MIHWPILGPVRQDRARADLSLLDSGLLLRALSLYPVDVSGLDLAAYREVAGATWDLRLWDVHMGKQKLQSPWEDTYPSGAAARVFWCIISSDFGDLLGGYSAELLLSPYHLTLMEQTLTWVVDKNRGVPGRKWAALCAKFSIYSGNDLHRSEHLQRLSFEANQLEEIKTDKTGASLPLTKSLPCLSRLNVLCYWWWALGGPLWPTGSGGKGCCGAREVLQGRAFPKGGCPLSLLRKGTSSKSWCR